MCLVSGHRLTPTLIAIVVMFLLLVTPSEILKFVLQHVSTYELSRQVFTAVIIMQVSRNSTTS